MATINATIPIVCADSAEYSRLLTNLNGGEIPDIVSFLEHLDDLTIDVTIEKTVDIPE